MAPLQQQLHVEFLEFGDFYGARWGTGVGTTSPNRGCCAGAPAGAYLGDTGGDALNGTYVMTTSNVALANADNQQRCHAMRPAARAFPHHEPVAERHPFCCLGAGSP